jgi:Ca-activated chloride channel family protein
MKENFLKLIVCVGLTIAIVLGSTATVLGDGMILPEPPWPEPGMSGDLEIEYHKVDVTINNQYAVTKVDQSFYNPYNVTMVGTYLFPVPEGAVLSNFTVIFDGKAISASIMDANEAKELFQQAVVERDDASLLQYIDNNIFSCKVTIPPKTSSQMKLQYEEILRMNAGMYKYEYTLSTERYSAVDIENVSVSVLITNDKNIDTIYSPSHKIDSERISSKKIYVNYTVHNGRPDKDFELYFSVTDKDFGASLLGYGDGEENFFMLFFNSNAESPEEYIPKDIIFVIDKSGSMSGDKIVQAKDALKIILQKLGNDDRFNIINFDSDIYTFSDNLEAANSKSLEEALAYVNNLGAYGSTDINDALLTAIEKFKNSTNYESPRIIFFLTDGLATDGVTDENKIVENVKNANIIGEVGANIFVFGVGYDVNTHLLDRISNDNQGGRAYVDPGESIEDALTELYSKIQNPMLTDITIEFSGIRVEDVFPKNIPNLYEGSEIVLTGKYSIKELTRAGGADIKVYINGSQGKDKKEYVFDFELINDLNNNFIPRIWATRKIGLLMDQIKLEGESDELIAEIKTLGLKYGIVTPYTSMLIKEQDDGITDGMSENQKDSDNDGVPDAWGISGNYSNSQSTINYRYQLSIDIQETTGANIFAYGNKVFANINGTLIDLELLKGSDTIELGNNSLEDWIMSNLDVTKVITFGSQKYFDLLNNKDLIEILSAGSEIVFKYQTDVFFITHGELKLHITNVVFGVIDSTVTISWYTNIASTSMLYYRLEGEEDWEVKQDSGLTTRHKFNFNLPDGDYEFYVSSEDSNENIEIDDSDGAYYRFTTPNKLPPLEIYNIASNVDGKKVTITWKTNFDSMGILSYRPMDSSSSWSILKETGFATKHEIMITSLLAGEYEYFISATDENTNTVIDDTTRYWEIESLDKDMDGMVDSWELNNGLDPNDSSDAYQDKDNDGLLNYEEYLLSTSPLTSDSDRDGMTDKWEITYLLDPNDEFDAGIDSDGDGYDNLNEFLYDTDPLDAKSHISSPGTDNNNPNQINIMIWVAVITGIVLILIVSLMVRNYRNKRDDEEFYQDYQDERVFAESFGDDFEVWDNKFDDWKDKKKIKKRKLKKTIRKPNKEN